MEMNSTWLTALSRAYVAFCEQLFWFALEGARRAHQLNLYAVEAFGPRRLATASTAPAIEARASGRGALTDYDLEQWLRAYKTGLSREIERLALESVAETRTGVRGWIPAARMKGDECDGCT